MTIATRGQGLSGEPPDTSSTSQVRKLQHFFLFDIIRLMQLTIVSIYAIYSFI